MTCKGCSNQLSAYVDGELSGHEMAEVRAHLGSCAACNAALESLRIVKHTISAQPALEPPDWLEERLVQSIIGNAQLQPGSRRLRFPAMGWLTAAALAAIVFVGILTLRSVRLDREQVSANAPSFELARDQAYVAGSEPLGGGAILPASYGSQ